MTKVTETRRARTVIVRYRYRYIDRRGVVIKAAFTGSAESPRRHNNELEYNSSASGWERRVIKLILELESDKGNLDD